MRTQSREKSRRHRHQRVRKKVLGTSDRPRLNVFRSLIGIYAQVIDDSAGRTLASASTLDEDIKPRLQGMNKTEQARLVGQAIAQRAREAGVAHVVFDRGGYRYHGRVKALAEAAREAGLQF